MAFTNFHPLAKRLARESDRLFFTTGRYIDALSPSQETGMRFEYDGATYQATRIGRGVTQRLDASTSERAVFDRFTLLHFGWSYRYTHGLARIAGPIKAVDLPKDVLLDTSDQLHNRLIWTDAAGRHEIEDLSPTYAHYLGLSLPYTLEELDAAIRHPTGAPIFVPQPTADPTAPATPPRTNPPEPPRAYPRRRPWRRKATD